MKNNTFDFIKTFLMFIFVTILITVFVVLLVISSDNKLIDSIKEFTRSETKVLYLYNENNYSDYTIDLLEKYEIKYKHIDTTHLSRFELKKVQNIIDNKNINNTIVVFKNGEVSDLIIDYTKEELITFLQRNNIIPLILGNPTGIIEKAKEYIESDLIMLFIPYEYDNSFLEQHKILSEIAKEYNINYDVVTAYTLSYVQKDKLNSVLKISSVEDQIVILIKDKKIIGSIRGINNKNTYLNALYEYKYITEIENYITEINYDEFNNILNSNETNVIIITKDDCKYCDTTITTLNKITIDYDVSIKYINIVNFDSEIASNIECKLIAAGYIDGFTTPLTVITQSNKVIDYIIGPSDEKYFIDIFKENGIIK